VGFFTSWPVSTPISTRLKCAASLRPRPAEQRPQRYPQRELEMRDAMVTSGEKLGSRTVRRRGLLDTSGAVKDPAGMMREVRQ
jgi:hypothetical protein